MLVHTVVLICMSLITNGVQHGFIHLSDVAISSTQKCDIIFVALLRLGIFTVGIYTSLLLFLLLPLPFLHLLLPSPSPSLSFPSSLSASTLLLYYFLKSLTFLSLIIFCATSTSEFCILPNLCIIPLLTLMLIAGYIMSWLYNIK